jgi:hypothetical protein
MQNRELKRKSAVLAQKCLKEASVSITDIADEADMVTSADGDLDSLMTTIKGMCDFVLILFFFHTFLKDHTVSPTANVTVF